MALSKHVYRVGEIEVDESLGCIKRNGEESYVRPKVFQLLLFLLEHRHRIVGKEELIESIWGATAVSDDALVQLMKEVRRALGDDPRRPQFIKTFPKMGYRFIGPAQEQLVGGAATVETREITTVEIEYEEESAGPDQPEPIRLALSAQRSNGWDRTRTTLVLALGAVIVLIISVVAFLKPRYGAHPLGEVTLPQAPGKKPLAVMYFENQSGGADLDWLREGLADILITDLSRSKRLTVLGRQQLHLLLERTGHKQTDTIRLDEAIDIGRQTRAEAVVMGSFARLGDKFHINVQLYDSQSGELLAAERVTLDKPDQVLSQASLLSLKLASRLGAAPDDQEAKTSLADVVTNNLDAYRCYSLAVEKVEAYHTAEAIALWEKAIALDPQFAMAYARIGYTYTLIRVNEAERGMPYLQKAFQLSERLTEKDRLYISSWYALANGDASNGIRLLGEIINQYPQEVEAYLRLGYQFYYAERAEEAIAVYKQGLLVDGDAKDIYNALGFSCLALGRYDEAIAAHAHYVELAPAEPNAHDSLGLTYIESGRCEAAIAEFEQALRLNPSFHFAHLHLGDVCFRLGRRQAALAHYRRFLELAPSDWDRSVGCHRLVLLHLKTGDLPGAEAAARQEQRHKTDLGGGFLVALARGDLRAIESSKEQLLGSSPGPRHSQLQSKMELFLRGCYALKVGAAAQAIEQFKEAVRHQPMQWNVDGVEDCLANAYLELGQLDEAILEYNRLLGINPQCPLAHFHLAQAYERKGESAFALSEYERFLQEWKDADTDLLEVVTARRRLTTLL